MNKFLAAVAALSLAPAAHAQGAPDANQIVHGRELFDSTGCYQCHGYVGQGGRITGPALLPHLMALPAFTGQLRTPVDHMPAYTAKVMSDADIAAIHAYLASLTASPDPASIPLLTATTKP